MRAYEIHYDTGPAPLDALVAVERETPTPGPGELLLRMRAAALNYRDLLVLRGEWPAPRGRVPLSDGVGTIVDVGPGVERARIGERVAPLFHPRWIDGDIAPDKVAVSLGGASADGVLAEYVVASEHAVARVPAHLSDAEAATLPCAALVAWNALAETGTTRPGDVVVVQGTGGVSLFALQFAALLGARVIATSSDDDKLRRALALGAAETINYRDDPEWPARVRALTGGRGADHVVEIVGADHLNESIDAARHGGTISVVGLVRGYAGEVRTADIMQKQLRVQGVEVGSRAMFERMVQAMARAGVRPVVDRTFALGDARAAYEYLGGRAHFGKVVVAVG